MESSEGKCKILIFGGSGYLGKHMVKASTLLGHPTYVYSRPLTIDTSLSKIDLLHEFQAMGVSIVHGELEEHEKLMKLIKQLDVVISILAYPQVFEQLKIIDPIKVAGNVKAVLNYEEDIAMYTIKVANDPRTCNRIVTDRPPKNIISQLELISFWEKKIGRNFNRVHISEEEIIKLSETLPHP